MGKLSVSTLVTLDGVVQDPGGFGETRDGGWGGPYFDEEAGHLAYEHVLASDVFLLGRETYELFKEYWTGSTRPTTRRGSTASPTGRLHDPARAAGVDATDRRQRRRGDRRTGERRRRRDPDVRQPDPDAHARRPRPGRRVQVLDSPDHPWRWQAIVRRRVRQMLPGPRRRQVAEHRRRHPHLPADRRLRPRPHVTRRRVGRPVECVRRGKAAGVAHSCSERRLHPSTSTPASRQSSAVGATPLHAHGTRTSTRLVIPANESAD